MKTVSIDYQTEKVLKLIAKETPLTLMERMEISLLVEVLKNTPEELGRPEWRSKYSDIMGN